MSPAGRPFSGVPATKGASLLLAAIRSRDLTHAEAAAMLGIGKEELSRFLSGKRLPVLAVAVQIERLFKVPPRAWLEPGQS